MGPERVTHEAPVLTAEQAALAPTLADARNAYIEAKQASRSWFRRLFRGAQRDAAVNRTRDAYEIAKARMIQIEARRAADATANETTNDADYRLQLAAQVAENIIREERLLTQREIQENRSNIFSRMKGILGDHPSWRFAIGWGLNAAIWVTAATGMFPLTWALVGTRGALGAMGTEAALEGLQNGYSGTFGARENLTPAQVGALNIDQVNQRIASFSEFRIKNRMQGEGETERLLRERRQELLGQSVNNEFTAEGLTNWQRHRAEATAQDATRAAEETARATAETNRANWETERNTREAERAAAETARDAAQTERDAREAERTDAEMRRDLARTAIGIADGILSEDRARGGLIDVAANVAVVEAACQTIVNADREIARLNSITPPPPNIALLIRAQEGLIAREKRDNIRPNVIGRGRAQGINANRVLDAYRERNVARTEETDQETRRAAAETERNNQEAERAARDAERAAAETARDAAEARRAAWEAERDARETARAAAEAARDASATLTEDQAVRIYNILVGGAAQGAVNARATSLVRDLNEPLNQLQETSLNWNRNSSRNRWIAAIAISGLVTWMTTPDVNMYDWTFNGAGPNPDLRFVPGNTDVSSLWGRGEGLYWDYLNQNGAGIADEAAFRNLVNSDPATHLRKIADYVNWVKINNPDALVPTNPDWVKHMPIREPGDLNRFFGTWAGPHQWDPGRSLIEAVQNIPTTVSNAVQNIPNMMPKIPNLRLI